MKSFNDIKTSMENFIRGKSATIDLSEGTIIDDIVISAPSQEIAGLYDENNTTSKGQSLLTASDSATDSLGGNLGILRLTPNSAQGIVNFFSYTSPANDITIPAGAIVSTYAVSGGNSIQFTVTTTIYMYTQLASSYLNPSNSVYEIAVPVEAIKSGVNGVVGPQSITQLVTSIPGIDGCYNPDATSGGTDAEDTSDLGIRTASKWRGNTIGVLDGYLSEVLAYPGVEDAIVFGGISTGRDDLGPVDIYVRGSNVVTFQDTFISYSSFTDLVLTKQPVIESANIQVISSQGGIISDLLYNLLKDTGAYAGSINGQDMIDWTSGSYVSSGSITVNYSYNSLIYDIQNYFSDPSRNVQNTNLLIKWTTETYIDITGNIRVSSGYDSNSVKAEIGNQLAIYMNNLNIGALIQQSDIVETILLIPGVDDLQLPLTLLQSSDASLVVDSFNNLQLPSKAYAVLGNLIINIV